MKKKNRLGQYSSMTKRVRLIRNLTQETHHTTSEVREIVNLIVDGGARTFKEKNLVKHYSKYYYEEDSLRHNIARHFGIGEGEVIELEMYMKNPDSLKIRSVRRRKLDSMVKDFTKPPKKDIID